jgi:hypothetical protein
MERVAGVGINTDGTTQHLLKLAYSENPEDQQKVFNDIFNVVGVFIDSSFRLPWICREWWRELFSLHFLLAR